MLLYMVTWIPSIYPIFVNAYIPAPWILWEWDIIGIYIYGILMGYIWNIHGIFIGWLVLEPTPLKNDGLTSSVGEHLFPTEWKHKTCSKPPIRWQF